MLSYDNLIVLDQRKKISLILYIKLRQLSVFIQHADVENWLEETRDSPSIETDFQASRYSKNTLSYVGSKFSIEQIIILKEILRA